MKSITVGLCVVAVLLMAFITSAFAGHAKDGYSPEMQAKIEEMKKELKKYTDDKATVDKNLETFDTLGLRREDETITFPVQGVDGGSVSMLSIQIG